MKNAFNKVSDSSKAEKAIQLAIMDIYAAEPTANKEDIISYMGSTAFENSVKGYIALMNEA